MSLFRRLLSWLACELLRRIAIACWWVSIFLGPEIMQLLWGSVCQFFICPARALFNTSKMFPLKTRWPLGCLRTVGKCITRCVTMGITQIFLVSNGLGFYRLQVKTLKKPGFEQVVVNKWAGSRVDYVIYFIHNQAAGCIARAFDESEIPLYRTSHIRFRTTEESFCSAFASI